MNLFYIKNFAGTLPSYLISISFMKRNLILFFLAFSILSFTPTVNPVKLTWETLRDVTFKKKWYPDEAVYMLYPTFGPSVQKLKGKEVIITGYILPIDLDANMYVLSAFPYSACFFCGGAGPESVMALKFKNKPRKFKTDERLTFKGILTLNADDIYQMNYVLEGAEVAE